jgi:hypothetical protein
MNSTAKPYRMMIATDLQEAAIVKVLLHGLTLDDDDPALGVLLGARRELGLMASLVECSRPGTEFDLGELVPVLESIGRRLDVAIELLLRAQRAHLSDDILEQARGAVLDGVAAP